VICLRTTEGATFDPERKYEIGTLSGEAIRSVDAETWMGEGGLERRPICEDADLRCGRLAATSNSSPN